jgi:hypothetical protein
VTAIEATMQASSTKASSKKASSMSIPIGRFCGTLAAVISFALLAPAPVRAEAVVFRMDIGLPNTVALMVRGQYTGNEILRVKSAIAEIEPGKRIIAVLDSPGGNVVQGEALGRFFYDAKIPTLVLAGSVCASACTYAFLGGRSPVTGNPLRILASGAKLGFHSFIATGLPERAYTKAELEEISRATQQLVFRNVAHMIHVKAPLKIMMLNTGTKNEDINFITEGDALEYGIAVLDRQSGKLVLPENIDKRTKARP